MWSGVWHFFPRVLGPITDSDTLSKECLLLSVRLQGVCSDDPPSSNLAPRWAVIRISLLLILELFQASVTFQSRFPRAVRNDDHAAETEGVNAGGPPQL